MSHECLSWRAMIAAGVAFLIASPGSSRAAESLQVVVDANSLAVHAGPAGLLRYRYGDVAFKPYVRELFTPAGLNVLLDSPPDHVHHHALMFACAVDGVDFWGEYAGAMGDRAADKMAALPGKQQPLRFDDVALIGPAGPPGPKDRGAVAESPLRVGWARFAESIRWVGQPNHDPLLMEHRTITAGRTGDPAVTFLTWESRLTVPEGKESAILTGSHYHGLGLRFVRSMDTNGQFRNPDNDPGVVFRGEERLARSRWCAYTAQVNGKTVTAAMFDHPANPRHPATWFMMTQPFAYLSATMRLHEEPLKVVVGKPVTLRYGVALWDGRPEAAQIDALYKQWITMTGPNAGEQKL